VSVAEAGARRARIRLRPGRERPWRDGHPWVFSGAVDATEGEPGAAVAEVRDATGEWLGLGLHAPGARIRVRRLCERDRPIDRAFFAERIGAAVDLRRRLVPEATDGYRLINAEGDDLPGWTVDRFGDVLISQITATGLERLRETAYGALAELFPAATIVHQGDLAARRREGLATDDETVAGPPPPLEVWFRESGLRFCAELAGGQKTGFYCDQRDSRRRVESLAGERSLLDLFSHSAAFSLYALRGGARRAVAVESAPRLLELARRQVDANGLDASVFESVRADVFADLRQREEKFDIVVCDPPPLARRRAESERAARAYKDLNRLALARAGAGGFLLTFSCSAAIDRKLFRQILFAAASEARVRVQLLAPLGAAPDHPHAVAHLEGDYLKGWFCRVAGDRD